MEFFRRFGLVVVFLAGFLCAQSTVIAQTPAAVESTNFRIGVLPNLSTRVILNQYQPVREFLGKALNRPVVILTAPDFSSFYERSIKGEYDLIVSASNLVQLGVQEARLQPIAMFEPTIRGHLVLSQSKALKSVAELRGQTIVFSAPNSLIAIRGRAWLRDNGLQADSDYKSLRLPNDESVASVLLRGDATAAIVSSSEFRAIPDELKKQLNIHQTFAEVPGFVLAIPDKAPLEPLRTLLLKQFPDSAEGKEFFNRSGLLRLRELGDELRALEPYMAETRRTLNR